MTLKDVLWSLCHVLELFSLVCFIVLGGGHVSGIQTIMTARVPIVKVIDRGTGIECDVSVENRDGMVKSLIIRAISTIDDRFQKLSFLVSQFKFLAPPLQFSASSAKCLILFIFLFTMSLKKKKFFCCASNLFQFSFMHYWLFLLLSRGNSSFIIIIFCNCFSKKCPVLVCYFISIWSEFKR